MSATNLRPGKKNGIGQFEPYQDYLIPRQNQPIQTRGVESMLA